MSSAICFNLDQSKILSSDNELTLSQTTNFRLFQTEIADDSFKFDEYSRKFSIRVDNTAGKGEIAHDEQFFLFQHCFLQKTYPADRLKQGLIWERVKWGSHDGICLCQKDCGKRRKCCYQHFLLFPQFLPL